MVCVIRRGERASLLSMISIGMHSRSTGSSVPQKKRTKYAPGFEVEITQKAEERYTKARTVGVHCLMTDEHGWDAQEDEASGPIGFIIALGVLFFLGCLMAETPCLVSSGPTIKAPAKVRIPPANGYAETNTPG